MTKRLVKAMGVRAAVETTFKALVTPGSVSEITMKNDTVLVGDALTRRFAQYSGWRMPRDHTTRDGSPPRQFVDYLTNLKVTLKMRLIPGTRTTRVQHEKGFAVRLWTIDGSVPNPAAALMVAMWLKVFVAEITNSRASRRVAESVLTRLAAVGKE